MMTKQTAHEKKVELAKAAAPQYGIYIDGGSTKALEKVIDTAGQLIMDILSADAEEKTKRQAMSLLEEICPTVSNLNISNCTLDMNK